MPDLQEQATEVAREAASRAPVALIMAAVMGGMLWVGLILSNNDDKERAELRAERAELIEQLIQCHELRRASSQRDTKP